MMKNLLQQGKIEGSVIPTELSRKLTIDGITNTYQVYKIRLDLLYYNDQNDRISTWISQYKTENGVSVLDRSDSEKYNSLIEEFIVKSNPLSIEKTQANIKLFDQKEYGVVLADGRIIDGNRRYTCLRRLSKEDDKFKYFAAVVLERSIESSAKEIKKLELSIQHGEESKIDYNPIERLVGVYNDIIDKKLLTIKEYARASNETELEVEKRVEIAKLMVEFLEFCNIPKQFHIARDLQVYAPFVDLVAILKKCKSYDEREDVKLCVFNNILMKQEREGDRDLRNFIRKFKRVIGSDYSNEFVEEQKEIARSVLNLLPPVGIMNAKMIGEIRSNDEILEKLKLSMDKAELKAKTGETRKRPIDLMEKATSMLEEIDVNIFSKLDMSEIKKIEEKLTCLDNLIIMLRSNLHE